jgi:hypothetical protein
VKYLTLLALLPLAIGCERDLSGEPQEDQPPGRTEAAERESSESEPLQNEALGTGEEAPTASNEEAEPAPSPYRCVVPPIPIPRPAECERGRSYPQCKWQMPHATLSEGRYRRWRNTIMEHWWGRPALVSYLLASLDDYERAFPEQVVAVGDLDAPGPRHRTHDNGVDFDIYLLGALMVENAGAGAYPSNYEGKSDEEVEALRERVETLARILATCAGGKIRIYYNDEVVIERFLAWYGEQSFPENPFGAPMRTHNHLHDFHFHATIPEDLPVLEITPLAEGTTHPVARIVAPPPSHTAPHLSSMNRRPGN